MVIDLRAPGSPFGVDDANVVYKETREESGEMSEALDEEEKVEQEKQEKLQEFEVALRHSIEEIERSLDSFEKDTGEL